MTTTAMPKPRIPSTETARTSARRLPTLKKAGSVSEKTTNISNEEQEDDQLLIRLHAAHAPEEIRDHARELSLKSVMRRWLNASLPRRARRHGLGASTARCSSSFAEVCRQGGSGEKYDFGLVAIITLIATDRGARARASRQRFTSATDSISPAYGAQAKMLLSFPGPERT